MKSMKMRSAFVTESAAVSKGGQFTHDSVSFKVTELNACS